MVDGTLKKKKKKKNGNRMLILLNLLVNCHLLTRNTGFSNSSSSTSDILAFFVTANVQIWNP